MGDLIEPSYEDLAERRANASRIAYHDRTTAPMKRHCAPEPITGTFFGDDEWSASHTGFVEGRGTTEDLAVSNYYALNNTTDKYPKKGREGQYH